MKHKLQLNAEEVYQKVIDSVSFARNLCDDVEWSCEDGTRTNLDFMCRTVEAAIKNGASTINIPDTVGYSIPDEFTNIITHLINNVPLGPRSDSRARASSACILLIRAARTSRPAS